MSCIWLKKILRPVYVPLIEKIRFAQIQHNYPIKVMSSLQTIRYIKKYNCSISRYGDGEFRVMLSEMDIGFQSYTESLADRLRKVISESDERLLVCFPKPIESTTGMKKMSATFWRTWCMKYDIRIQIFKFISMCGKQNILLGDAMLTRPYMDWKSKRRAKRIFDELKSIWKERDILIVEGEQTRLGVGNDLFAGAKSIKRILAPTLNAYASYDRIVDAVLRIHNNELVILALGPTATVLAADLSKLGIQALDIGHLDIEYEWYLDNAEKKEAISGKYTNEVYEGHTFSRCDDSEYQDQILENIDC